MNIAIIGAGNVGGTLARRWADIGHQVTIGAQDPASDKSRTLAQSLKLPVVSLAEAARSADALLLATPGDATITAAQACGDLTGKILIDATNPITGALAGLDHPNGQSGAQRLQLAHPSAHVVKAFNTVGFNIMANPVIHGQKSVLLLSGDDGSAVTKVSRLATELGFEPLVIGAIATSRMQEEHALLWIHLAVRGGLGRGFFFSLVKTA
jgi:predicted dinucleotide-binding enzyme